jgi:hypothetical protein
VPGDHGRAELAGLGGAGEPAGPLEVAGHLHAAALVEPEADQRGGHADGWDLQPHGR